jgi:uncharacterized oxidoreductase
VLEETTAANPGMASLTLDIEDPQAILAFAARVTAEHPGLNVVINNAGAMRPEALRNQPEAPRDAEAMVTTNLLGPIRLTAALLPHLLKRPRAAILNVTSGLAFLPLALTPTYCATKAALHSYTQSMRYQLKDTAVQVIELAPPYVQTELTGPGQASDPRAMPLKDYIAETVRLLETSPDAEEILVERVKPLRFAEASGEFAAAFKGLNDSMTALPE